MTEESYNDIIEILTSIYNILVNISDKLVIIVGVLIAIFFLHKIYNLIQECF